MTNEPRNSHHYAHTLGLSGVGVRRRFGFGHMAIRSAFAVANAPAEWMAIVEQEGGFAVHECGPRDGRRDFSRATIQPLETSGKGAADDAFLDPAIAFFEFPVCRQTGNLGAGAGAAGRAVVRFA